MKEEHVAGKPLANSITPVQPAAVAARDVEEGAGEGEGKGVGVGKGEGAGNGNWKGSLILPPIMVLQ